MNYNADKPIETKKKDKLGRAAFAKHLARGIIEYEGKDGLVIGLYGRWGSGKTSIINMALEEIKELLNAGESKSKNTTNKNRPIIYKFSPWNYSDKSDLIGLFFRGLKHEIEDSGKDSFKNTVGNVGKLLTDYIEVLDTVSMLPIIGSGAAAILKILAQAQNLKNIREADLDKTKEKLEEALRDSKQKIVVVIDDIDRLTNSQIRDIFQLVKQVGNFPYVTYILAMDREIVRKALEEVQNFDGEEYLEKIIQIPFEIPMLREEEVGVIFKEELLKIIDEANDDTYDLYYFDYIFKDCVIPYIKTLREVYRVINTFRFRYGYLKGEINFADLLALTTVEVIKPGLYKWIANNKRILVGGLLAIERSRNIDSNGKQIDEIRQVIIEKIRAELKGTGVDFNTAICSIATLFPLFAVAIGSRHSGSVDSDGLSLELRVASYNKFERYFTFDLNREVITRAIMKRYLYEYDTNEIIESLREKNMGDQEYVSMFMEDIPRLLVGLPYHRLKIVVDALYDFLGETVDAIKEREDDSEDEYCMDLEDTQKEIVRVVCGNIIRIEDPDEKFEAICFAMDKFNQYYDEMEKLMLWIDELDSQEDSDIDEEWAENPGDELFKKEYLDKIKKTYASKMKSIREDLGW